MRVLFLIDKGHGAEFAKRVLVNIVYYCVTDTVSDRRAYTR